MSREFPDRHRRGVVLVLTGAALWSMGGLLLHIIEVDELTTIFWRALFAVLALSVYLSWACCYTLSTVWAGRQEARGDRRPDAKVSTGFREYPPHRPRAQ
jgi:hypothetical protein